MINIQPVISNTLSDSGNMLSLSKAKTLLNLGESVTHNALEDAKDLKDVYLVFKRKYV